MFVWISCIIYLLKDWLQCFLFGCVFLRDWDDAWKMSPGVNRHDMLQSHHNVILTSSHLDPCLWIFVLPLVLPSSWPCSSDDCSCLAGTRSRSTRQLEWAEKSLLLIWSLTALAHTRIIRHYNWEQIMLGEIHESFNKSILLLKISKWSILLQVNNSSSRPTVFTHTHKRHSAGTSCQLYCNYRRQTNLNRFIWFMAHFTLCILMRQKYKKRHYVTNSTMTMLRQN